MNAFRNQNIKWEWIKFKKIRTKLCENQWIILQLSLWGVTFNIKSVFYLNFLH